jgi:hypothetical protein
MRTEAGQLWEAYRTRILERDGDACTRCFKGASDGAVLQVHHERYILGFKPWDYPDNECVTLCRGCHAAEHGKIPPPSGWMYGGYDDLGDLSGSCEYCREQLRHVFLIVHPSWPALSVGSDCCDRMTGGADASALRRSLASVRDRRKRFVASPRWHWRSKLHYVFHSGVWVWVRQESGGFRIWINQYEGKALHPSLEVAKGAVFDGFEDGSVDRYLARKPKWETEAWRQSRFGGNGFEVPPWNFRPQDFV